VTGAAYYNNDRDPDTATLLFVLDTNRGQVATLSPANSGLLARNGSLGIGVDADSDAGLEIHYRAAADGAVASRDGRALAGMQVNGASQLYWVELA